MNYKKLGTPTTIGELNLLIKDYADDTPFGFRNQHIQELVEDTFDDKKYISFNEILHVCHNEIKFIATTDKPLTQEHGEVIGFHPEWIHPDFNPNGTRVGFINGDDKFHSAMWWDYQDTYTNDSKRMPTHYFIIPKHP